jgi:hypothetical protein
MNEPDVFDSIRRVSIDRSIPESDFEPELLEPSTRLNELIFASADRVE